MTATCEFTDPNMVLGHLFGMIQNFLEEKQAPDHIREALADLAARFNDTEEEATEEAEEETADDASDDDAETDDAEEPADEDEEDEPAPPRTAKRWSTEEDAFIRDYMEEGVVSAKIIARHLNEKFPDGERTPASIQQRICKLKAE